MQNNSHYGVTYMVLYSERSSFPSKNFPCISMDMLQIGALMLLGRLVEVD